MEDGVDHHHCDSHRWGGIIPKHSLGIITVLSQSFSQVIQFFLFAKGEPQSWNNQEKATRRGKDWFLVSSKGFHSCWKLRKNFFANGWYSPGCLHSGDCPGGSCVRWHHDGHQWQQVLTSWPNWFSSYRFTKDLIFSCTLVLHIASTQCAALKIIAKQYYGGEAGQVYCMQWEL